ncbi:hypothetical protein RUM44_003184 [Polyplax serrata]|uniref:Uncharacterized protein n=1 Tax=Polyplax serrata TaxID=468196 RepID=A0ABR1AYF9_POLSC
MGAHSSTQNGDSSSPRARTFSTSSSSDVVGGAGLSMLHATQSAVLGDRQRARSLSSVPNNNSSQDVLGIPNANNIRTYDISESPETDSSSEDQVLDSPLAPNLSWGRVYTAHSLRSRISTLNGECVII